MELQCEHSRIKEMEAHCTAVEINNFPAVKKLGERWF